MTESAKVRIGDNWWVRCVPLSFYLPLTPPFSVSVSVATSVNAGQNHELVQA